MSQVKWEMVLPERSQSVVFMEKKKIEKNIFRKRRKWKKKTKGV